MYHWNDKEKLNKDNNYLTELYEKNLIYISNILNDFHHQKNEVQYWRIIVGPWLRFFIDIVFDRYETLRIENKILNYNNKYIQNKFSSVRSKDFNSFFNDSFTDDWNKNLLSIINCSDIDEDQYKKQTFHKKDNLFIKRIIKEICININNLINRKFNKNVLIIDPYIDIKTLINFSLRSRIFPYFTKRRTFKGICQWDIFIQNLPDKEFFSNFEKILNDLILIYIPSIYTDDFINFRSIVLNDFKKLPKIIFTSTGYQGNEEFKLIAAETYINGGKILIGQHGGNMGLAKHNQAEQHQIKIANKLYTYGWTLPKSKKVKAMPSMKLSSLKAIKAKNEGEIINVMASVPRYFYCLFSMPLGPEYLKYIDLQKDLHSFLRKDISSRVIHRLNGDKYGWNATELLKSKGLRVCQSNLSIRRQLSRSSLCISSYNGTVALETLSLNFPTILYWPNNIFEIRGDALSYLNYLAEVGIYHNSAKSAGDYINRIIDDIDGWWYQKSVQKARKTFIGKFAKTKKDWVDYWMKELLEQF